MKVITILATIAITITGCNCQKKATESNAETNNSAVKDAIINNKTQRGPDHFPFLGVKSSGMGTQGIRYSIEAMSRPKAIVVNFNTKF